MITPPEEHTARRQSQSRANYWSQSLRVVYIVLSVWLFVSLGCGILFRDLLDTWLPPVGGAPFGFWMAQQGSIISFLLLLFLYRFLMNRLDKRFGFGERDRS
jgi:putative solute:sodium symporter small subunit